MASGLAPVILVVTVRCRAVRWDWGGVWGTPTCGSPGRALRLWVPRLPLETWRGRGLWAGGLAWAPCLPHQALLSPPQSLLTSDPSHPSPGDPGSQSLLPWISGSQQLQKWGQVSTVWPPDHTAARSPWSCLQPWSLPP